MSNNIEEYHFVLLTFDYVFILFQSEKVFPDSVIWYFLSLGTTSAISSSGISPTCPKIPMIGIYSD